MSLRKDLAPSLLQKAGYTYVEFIGSGAFGRFVSFKATTLLFSFVVSIVAVIPRTKSLQSK